MLGLACVVTGYHGVGHFPPGGPPPPPPPSPSPPPLYGGLRACANSAVFDNMDDGLFGSSRQTDAYVIISSCVISSWRGSTPNYVCTEECTTSTQTNGVPCLLSLTQTTGRLTAVSVGVRN